MNKSVRNHGLTKKTKSNNTSKKSIQSNIVHLWNILDEEKDIQPQIECIYDQTFEQENELCKTCNIILSYNEDGYLMCSNPQCAITYNDIIDQSAEWRYYGADDNNSQDPTRCGMPIDPLLEQSSYGSHVIAQQKMTPEMYRLRRWTHWISTPNGEKSLYNEFKRITTMAHLAGISKMIIDDALYYHKIVSGHEKTFRGDNRDGIIAASVYISCRKNNNPRTAKEIADIFALDITSATKGCKNAQVIINDIEKDTANVDKTHLKETVPRSFIARFCSKLNMNHELTVLSSFIADKIHENDIMPENTPISIAAGLLYFVSQMCNLNINKQQIHIVSGISEVTINSCYKKLELIKDTLIPERILKKYC